MTRCIAHRQGVAVPEAQDPGKVVTVVGGEDRFLHVLHESMGTTTAVGQRSGRRHR